MNPLFDPQVRSSRHKFLPAQQPFSKPSPTSLPPLPKAIEIEEGLLGAIMYYPDALVKVIGHLRPEHFFDVRHQKIYKALQTLFQENKCPSEAVLLVQLRKDGALDEAGGAAYVVSLAGKGVIDTHVETYLYLLLEYAMRRDIIKVTHEEGQKAYDETEDVFDLVERLEKKVFDVLDCNLIKDYKRIDAVAHDFVEKRRTNRNRGGGLLGVPSGFPALDKMLKGWRESDLIVVAARPGMGKTAFLLSLLRNAAIDHRLPVAFFSLEMTSTAVFERLTAAEVGWSVDKVNQGGSTNEEERLFNAKTVRLCEAPIFLDDTPAITLLELRAKCRRLRAKHQVQLIAVDYLQIMAGVEGRNREQEIGYISRGLKALAKELKIPIIAASQLSRAVETRGGERYPMLSDLRDSGSIEQDADQVLFLYRPEYYGLEKDEEGYPTNGLAEVIIAKHRNGAVGKIQLRFLKEQMKFEAKSL